MAVNVKNVDTRGNQRLQNYTDLKIKKSAVFALYPSFSKMVYRILS